MIGRWLRRLGFWLQARGIYGYDEYWNDRAHTGFGAVVGLVRYCGVVIERRVEARKVEYLRDRYSREFYNLPFRGKVRGRQWDEELSAESRSMNE